MTRSLRATKCILLVDGNNIAWRAASIIEDARFEDPDLSTSLLDSMLNRRIREMKADAGVSSTSVVEGSDVIVDGLGYDEVVPLITFDAGYRPIANDAIINRYELLKSYKLNRREADPDKVHLNKLRSAWKNKWRDSLLERGLAVVEHPCVEADDLMAYAADLASKQTGDDVDVAIWTVDKDLMQIVDDDPHQRVIMYRKRYSVVNGKRRSEERRVDAAEVIREKQVPPSKIRMLLALAGDSADDYAGVKGYGGKRGVSLVQRSNGIDDLKSMLREDLSHKHDQAEVESEINRLDLNWLLAGCGRDWMPTSAAVGVELAVSQVCEDL